MTPEKLTVGQEVVMVRTNRWKGTPPQVLGSGRVISVGRRYAFAEIDGRDRGSREFDMATGYARGDDNGNGWRIITAEQADSEQRRTVATAILAEFRVHVGLDCSLPADQLEAMAAILRDAPDITEGE